MNQPKSGYTLPVFACAGAIAALQHLQNHQQNSSNLPPPTTITLDLISPNEAAEIAIAQVALLSPTSALAITY
ncbi:MAG: cobalt-precorrin-5B (C(1))-methyltransferase, partial [Phormidesmis priestleyi]